MYFLNEPVFCEKIKGKNGLIYVISSSNFQTSSIVLIFFAVAFLIINKFERVGAEKNQLLTRRLLKLSRVIPVHTEFANFAGLDFLHFTTVRDQTLQFYESKFSV